MRIFCVFAMRSLSGFLQQRAYLRARVELLARAPCRVGVVAVLCARARDGARIEERFVDVGAQRRGVEAARIDLESLPGREPIDEDARGIGMRRLVGHG